MLWALHQDHFFPSADLEAIAISAMGDTDAALSVEQEFLDHGACDDPKV